MHRAARRQHDGGASRDCHCGARWPRIALWRRRRCGACCWYLIINIINGVDDDDDDTGII